MSRARPRARSLLVACSVAALGVALAAVLTALGPRTYRSAAEVYFAPSATLDASAHARVASFAALVDGHDGVRARVLADSLVVRLSATADDPGAARTAVDAATTLLQQRASTLETSGRGLSATVVSPAGGATALARPWARNLAIGLILGILVGAALGRGVGRRARRLHSGSDVEARVATWAVDGVPVAGQVAALVSVPDPDDGYARLAGGLRYLDVDVTGGTFVLAGAHADHDVTEVAVRLAARLVEDGGGPVVLVDAALRRPEVADLLALPEGRRHGLTSVLAGDDQLHDALVVHEPTGLTVLPAGPEVPVASSIMASRALEHLLSDLRRDDATVLVVTDALAAGDGAAWAAGAADGVVLVLRDGRDTDRALLAGADALETHGGRLRAVVLTRVASAVARHDDAPTPIGPVPEPATKPVDGPAPDDPEQLVFPMPASVIPAQRTPEAAERLPAEVSEDEPEPSSLSLLEEFLTDEHESAETPVAEPVDPDPRAWSWADDEEPTESIWRPRAR